MVGFQALMHEKDFVLRLLCEIALSVKHPLLKMTARELLQKLDSQLTGNHGVS